MGVRGLVRDVVMQGFLERDEYPASRRDDDMPPVHEQFVGRVQHRPAGLAGLQGPHDRHHVEPPIPPRLGTVDELLDRPREAVDARGLHRPAVLLRRLDGEYVRAVVRPANDLQELSLAAADIANRLAPQSDRRVGELGHVHLSRADGGNARGVIGSVQFVRPVARDAGGGAALANVYEAAALAHVDRSAAGIAAGRGDLGRVGAAAQVTIENRYAAFVPCGSGMSGILVHRVSVTPANISVPSDCPETPRSRRSGADRRSP